MDPVNRLLEITRKLKDPLAAMMNTTTADEFDRLFRVAEPDILAWKDAYNGVDKTNVTQMNTAIRVANLVLPLLGQVHQKSIQLGATKGRLLPLAPAAGGYKRSRKMTRRYCKKTSCRKMGFTQKASCRPYKNCYRKKLY